MKLPLFRAALKEQRMSMWIYVIVMLAYGMMIMMAFLSVENTLTDPFSEAEGIKLSEMASDADEETKYNLTWETKAGISFHIALGFKDNGTIEEGLSSLDQVDGALPTDLMTDLEGYLGDDPDFLAFLASLEDGGTGTDPIRPYPLNDTGMELVYFGTGTHVNFLNPGHSKYFMVGLVPSDLNISNTTFLGPVSSLDLVVGSGFDEYLEDNPMMEAFFGDEVISFTELDGFIALEFFSMWPLMLLIFIAIKAGSTVSKHVDDRSMDILLSTGYSRVRFLNEKMLVVLVNLILVSLGAWLGIILGVIMLGKAVPLTGITLSFLGALPMALGIIGLSLLLSVLIDESSKVTGAIMGLVIFMFMIQIVSNIAGWQDGLGYISLFTYYNVNELMVREVVDWVNVIVPSLVGMISIAASYMLFKKKEIYA